ncbi:MAG: hypothetical protein KDD62_08800, partial [Bdellovibrionales bacterium]|nr:hypothetical protein [Bdellovibrionales bacterium]
WCSVIEPEINPAPFETVQMHFFCALAFQGSGGSQRAAISFYHVVCASDFSGPLERGYAAEALIRLADLLVTSRDSEVLGQALARLRGETSDTRALAAYYYTWGKALAEENREDLDELAEEASLGLERIRWGH